MDTIEVNFPMSGYSKDTRDIALLTALDVNLKIKVTGKGPSEVFNMIGSTEQWINYRKKFEERNNGKF